MNDKLYITKEKIVRSTPRKLALVANLIKKQKVSHAINCLHLCNKRAALPILKSLSRCIADVENNFNADIDNLYVEEVLVGKSLTLKRLRPRAKGRGMRILKRYSVLKIKLKAKGAN